MPTETSLDRRFRKVCFCHKVSYAPRRYGLELATINKNVISFLSENPDLSRNYLNGSTREVPWEERKCKRQKMCSVSTTSTLHKNTNNSATNVTEDSSHVSLELFIKYDDLLAKPVVLALHDLYAVLWTSDANFKSAFQYIIRKIFHTDVTNTVKGLVQKRIYWNEFLCTSFTTPSIVEMLSREFESISSILAAIHLSFIDQFDETTERLSLNSWGLAHDRTRMAYDHLYYSLRIPAGARMFVTKDATGVGMFLLFVSYFQGVLSFKRKEGMHVTYESEAWSNALNHMIRLGSRFFGVLTDVIVNEDISPTDSTSITDRERNRKMSLLNFSTYVPATKLPKASNA